jgi:hypothetical protein
MRFIRSIIYWRWTERNPGEYDFGAQQDKAQEGLENNVGMIWTFEPRLPDWVNVEHKVQLGTPENLPLFEAWVEAGMEALPHEDMAVEFVNEPDISVARTKLATEEQAIQVSATFQKAGYRIVKALNPNIDVLGAATTGKEARIGGFSQKLLAAIDGDIDYYSAHLYNSPRYIKADKSVLWPDEYLRPKLLDNTKLAAEYTRKKQLWSTELGWAYPMNEDFLSPATYDYAAITAQGLVLMKTVEGVGKIAWMRGFEHRPDLNERGYDYSLFVIDGSRLRPTTGVPAYATVSSLLEGSETGQELDLGPAVKCYLFENHATDQAIAALWSTHYDVSLEGEFPEGITKINIFGRESTEGPLYISRGPMFLQVPLEEVDLLRDFLEKADWRPEQAFIVTNLGANTTDELRLSVESLLLEPVEAEITLGKNRILRAIQPGRNDVLLPVDPSDLNAKQIDLPLSITGAGASYESIIEKPVITVPYVPTDKLSLDQGLTSAKEALAVNELDKLIYIRPPDPGLWNGSQDLSVSYGYAWNEQGLYAIFRVHDDALGLSEQSFWYSDSIQFALDPLTLGGRTGFQPGQREVGLFLKNKANATVVQTYPPRDDSPELPIKLTQERDGLTYEIFVPWTYLYGQDHKPRAGDVLAANFIVNDNDGNGRKCWIGLVDGIGAGKQPDVYPWLILQE